MAQLETMVCFGCGESISNKYEAFIVMREAIINYNNNENAKKVRPDNKMIYPSLQENIEIVFEELKIKRICCRTHIANAVPIITLK